MSVSKQNPSVHAGSIKQRGVLTPLPARIPPQPPHLASERLAGIQTLAGQHPSREWTASRATRAAPDFAHLENDSHDAASPDTAKSKKTIEKRLILPPYLVGE